MPLDLTGGSRSPASYTSIDEVTQRYQSNHSTYHRAPSFHLASYIDSHVTTQMRVFVFTLKVSLAGINVSFISIVGVVLNFILCHNITSLVDCFVVGVQSFLVRRYGIRGNRQCEPVGWVMVVENYHLMDRGL